MENIKLLVFDIDGTLVDRSKQTIEESALDAINAAKANGYEVLIATGRSFFFIHDDVIENLDTDYYVTVNGACLNNTKGEIIESYAFDKESLKTLIKYCKDNQYPLGIKYNTCIGVYGDFETFASAYIGLDHPNIEYLVHDKDEDFYLENEPLGVFYYAPRETLEEVSTLIPKLNFIPGDKSSMEAIRYDVDKTKNIEDVLKRLNMTWDNVMSFGDGNNDAKMLQLAKIGVAMGNAEDEVKAHADYVTDHILEDGIKNALLYFNIIKE